MSYTFFIYSFVFCFHILLMCIYCQLLEEVKLCKYYFNVFFFSDNFVLLQCSAVALQQDGCGFDSCMGSLLIVWLPAGVRIIHVGLNRN